MRMRIVGGRALVEGRLEEASIHLDSEVGIVTAIGAQASAEPTIDASGLLVLPGIVDIHGDAFERQMMPRPGVGFPIDVALLESDRQAVANGITTVFHGVTWSWEGGLRGHRMRAPFLTASSACDLGLAPTPAIIFGTRPSTSMPRPRSSPGSPSAGST
jgi:alpha-D-ribose 1-methylphosphonate 5-triphosphate diphosphatase